MAYDPALGNVVLFGGGGSTDRPCTAAQFGDTWTYNGTTWTQQSPTVSPSARQGAVMANDPATGELVVFGGGSLVGGAGCHGVEFNDTWRYDGASWSQRAPSINPTVREAARWRTTSKRGSCFFSEE